MYTYYFGAPCVQLMGADGAIGCACTYALGMYCIVFYGSNNYLILIAGDGGVDGWMYPIQSVEEWDAFRASPESGPLVIMLASDLFTPYVI